MVVVVARWCDGCGGGGDDSVVTAASDGGVQACSKGGGGLVNKLSLTSLLAVGQILVPEPPPCTLSLATTTVSRAVGAGDLASSAAGTVEGGVPGGGLFSTDDELLLVKIVKVDIGSFPNE
ncbi:hypothetical protein QJS10_CPB18g00258 [Acorus calamus]|uniref:Uncharacterized protein n=1 Tax=Acorus calamus TaxID=4465 RepID=A0AAV9CQA7_ACOCL|nr:hypothetical protein QJS10_CPB18g00258 [Acorus calamus]